MQPQMDADGLRSEHKYSAAGGQRLGAPSRSGLFAAVLWRVVLVQDRPEDRSPEFVALGIWMQAVLDAEIGPRAAFAGQHWREDVHEEQPVLRGGVFLDEAVGGLDLVEILLAGGTWLDGDVGDLRLRERSVDTCHERLEVTQDALRGLARSNVVVARIEQYQLRLVGSDDAVNECDGV